MKPLGTTLHRQRILEARKRAEQFMNVGPAARCQDCEDKGLVFRLTRRGNMSYTVATLCPTCPRGQLRLDAENREVDRINDHRRKRGQPEIPRRKHTTGPFMTADEHHVEQMQRAEPEAPADCPY